MRTVRRWLYLAMDMLAIVLVCLRELDAAENAPDAWTRTVHERRAKAGLHKLARILRVITHTADGMAARRDNRRIPEEWGQGQLIFGQ